MPNTRLASSTPTSSSRTTARWVNLILSWIYFFFIWNWIESIIDTAAAKGRLAESRHFPQLVRHQRRVFPVRLAELQDEMGFLDLRRIPGILHQTLFSFSPFSSWLNVYNYQNFACSPNGVMHTYIGKKPWELKRTKKPKLFQKRAACVPRSSRNSWGRHEIKGVTTLCSFSATRQPSRTNTLSS